MEREGGEMAPRTAERGAVADLYPGYFALVMATGIVSIAAFVHGFPKPADILFWFNAGAYAVLWVLTLMRLVRFPARLAADLTTHQRGSGFLTIVAGTAVLGTQAVLLKGALGIAIGLWVAAVALWALLMYAFVTAVTVLDRKKPTLDVGINGSWLLLIVSTESLAVLGAVVAPHMPHTHGILFASLAAHLVGWMLYIVVIGLIFYRWTFFGMHPEQTHPPYWINMGALAITAVAGANLLAAAPDWPFLQEIAPFLKAGTVLFWAFASWWIPLLLIVGVWRHGVQRVKLAYDPQYWSAVFPLGMYSVATYKILGVTGLSSLEGLSTAFLWIAVGVWALTFAGMVGRIASARPKAPDLQR